MLYFIFSKSILYVTLGVGITDTFLTLGFDLFLLGFSTYDAYISNNLQLDVTTIPFALVFHVTRDV